MENKLSKVRLKRNESFNIREGWLRKGMKLLPNHPDLFSLDEAMQLLGVGSKMVKSIKYWLLTTGLAKEQKVKSKTELVITEELGEVINQYDPYFEDLFTLYILHANIASDIENATVWYLFFNNYDAKTFTKEDIFKEYPVSHSNVTPNDTDGIYLVSATKIKDFLENENAVIQLRYDSRTKVNTSKKILTYGKSKGATYENVLVYPTINIKNALLNDDFSKITSRIILSKLYVALTRAKHKVGIAISDGDIKKNKNSNLRIW